jgi:ATP-binding cassette subfamily F protein 3
MIKLDNITLRRGAEPLIEKSSATIYPGHHVGLVGGNGTGKSSLFSLLQGELGTDAGEVHVPSEWTISHLAQETPALERSAIDHVMDGDTELRAAEAAIESAHAGGDGHAIAEAHARYDNAGGYTARARAGELLAGLGFPARVHDQPVAAFSGGWRVRINLARALMCPSDLLLLDEPTNHLDLEAVLWLEGWLRQYPGTLILISHDRDFLDAVCGEILHIERRRMTLYRGGYSDFERQRAEHLAQQQAMYEKQQREIAHMQKFIDRWRAQANKAKAAQSRVKAIERMEKVAPAHVDSPFEFGFPDAPEASSPLISLQGVSLGYGDQPILRAINLSLRPGARVGLLGPNGAGKSTLIRALAGEKEPIAGDIVRGRNIRVGYFAQHQLDQLDTSSTPVAHIQQISPNARLQRVRDFLGGFGFHGEQATGSVAPFSGGEKARLVLALLVWQAPNLLLLDEPTNHLDLEMRHALTVALQGYEGAVVTVSHDRHLLNSTVDDYVLVADGEARAFDGDLNDYHRWLKQRDRDDGPEVAEVQTAEAVSGATAPEPAETSAPADRKEARRQEAARRQAIKPLKDRVQRLLDELAAVDAEVRDIETKLADPALYNDDAKERLNELLRHQGELKSRYEELETEWMAAEEELEAAQASA